MTGVAAPEGSAGVLPGKAARSAGAIPRRVRRTGMGPLLIVGEEGSPLGGALRVAEAVARRHAVKAHVLVVLRPLTSRSPYLLSRADVLERLEREASHREAEHIRLRRLVHEIVGRSSFFSTGVETGEYLPTVASAARVRKVEYVFVGLPELGAPTRAGAETAALRLARTVDLPVLAVPAGADFLPRTALVSMALGEASMRAARATIPLLALGGNLTLAQVLPDAERARSQARPSSGPRILDRALERLRSTLRLARDLQVRTTVSYGDPAKALLELGRDVDLIAVGMPLRRVPGRRRTEIVAVNVLRGTVCTVLMVPAPRQGEALA